MFLVTAGCSRTGQGNRTTLKILHVNDIHSFLDPEEIDLVLDHAETTCQVGGMARVAGLITRLTGEDENNLVLHAGDALQGTLYYTLFQGEADARVMNTMGFDAMAMGNHEFDDGDDHLAGFIRQLDTAVVSANMTVAPGNPLENLYTPYIIREIDKILVGIIGLTPARVTRSSSRPSREVNLADEVSAVQAAVDDLSARGVGRIILVSHCGYQNDLALAPQVTDVDVIVGGHSHTLLGDFQTYGLNSDGSYPTMARNADGDPVCVVQAWEHGRILGELSVTFQGDVLSHWAGTPHLVLGDQFSRKDGDGNARPVEDESLGRITAAIDADPKADMPAADESVTGVIREYSDQVDALDRTVIGSAGEDLLHIRIPGITQNGAALPLGSQVAPLVARAFYDRDPRADLCIQNGGGVRTGIPAGEISIRTAYEMLPFANTLFEIEMTGALIQKVLEDALEYVTETGANGAFPYAYGLRYDVDIGQAYGQRVSGLEVRNRTTGSYTPLLESTQYVVLTSSYLAEGRDGYTAFAEARAQGESSTDTYLDYAFAFVSYVKELTAEGQTLESLPAGDHCIKGFMHR
jgi:5'-nucleotidase